MENKNNKYKHNNVTSNLSSEVVSALVNSVLKNHKNNNNNHHNLLTKNSSDSDSEKEMDNKGTSKSINQIEKSYLIQIL